MSIIFSEVYWQIADNRRRKAVGAGSSSSADEVMDALRTRKNSS